MSGIKEQPHQAEQTGLEIAIIGMAGRFPGAGNIDEFWENLKNSVESLSFSRDEELKASGIDREVLENPDYVRAIGGVFKGKEFFDAGLFGYTRYEAEIMDPQIRKFHECVWEALENAGYNGKNHQRLIGLYAGASPNFNWKALTLMSKKRNELGNFAANQLTGRDFLATHISYKLNLKGPAFTVLTACSTSLAAIHLACQSLLNGECQIALAGGVSIQPIDSPGYLFQEGLINSPDGHCRAFDAKAGGTVGGNGVGVVVLKSLDEALADGDYIHAVIKSTAMNNDGSRKGGYSAPSIEGQAEVIATALQVANLDPGTIGYIETHGTGTSLGDPIEIEALKMAFGKGKKGFCPIGSVKSNIGHLDAAAGVAGLIKAILVLKYRLIPPSLHFEHPNPGIDFENSPFYVNRKLTEWKSNGTPLRAGVSSFGIGGTNVHAILEESPQTTKESDSVLTMSNVSIERSLRRYQLILLAGRTPAALERLRQNLAGYLRKNSGQSLADVAFTLQVGRRELPHRCMLVCSSVKEAIARLSTGEPGNFKTSRTTPGKQRLVWMFSGQGSQYINMGRELYRAEPVFRKELDRCFEILNSLMSDHIKEILYPEDCMSKVSRDDPAPSTGTGESPLEKDSYDPGKGGEGDNNNINRTEIVQPLIFAFEYALAKLLMKWGIIPYAMVGHSIGEFVAAHLSGVFSLGDALKLVTLRGKLMQQMPTGSMLSVGIPLSQLQSLIPGDIVIAAVNTPSRCVVSGSHDAIKAFARGLEEKGYETRLLHTSHAFHSPMMNPIVPGFKKAVSQLSLFPPKIPYISNVSGTWITTTEAVEAEYWARQLKQPVYFSDGIGELLKQENLIFVEVGPGKALSTFVRQHPDKKDHHAVINLIRHPQENSTDQEYLATKLGDLWLYGGTIDWEAYHEEKRYRLPLPGYPFEENRYWLELQETPFQLSEMGIDPGKFTHSAPGLTEAEPFVDRPELRTRLLVPRTDTERTLAGIWERFFGVKEVGIRDDFFELGGDSLKATTLTNIIHKELDVQIPVSEIFNRPVIEKLALYIDGAQKSIYSSIVPIESKEYYPQSSAQKRHFFLQQFEDIGTSYNMPLVLEMKGQLDKKRFKEALHKLSRRHETLRTSFLMVNDEPVQRIHDSVEIKVEENRGFVKGISNEDLSQIMEDFLQPFDLARAPLMRVNLLTLHSDQYLVLFDIHHIISDGTTMGILSREFARHFAGDELSLLNIQYKDFSVWQNDLFESGKIKEQEEYWLGLYPDPDDIPRLNLPLDYPRPAVFRFEGAAYSFVLGNEEALAFKKMLSARGATLFIGILAVFSLLLHKYTDQSDIIIGCGIAGRHHAELQNIIGMFVNSLAIRNHVNEGMTFETLLQAVKKTSIQAFENQDIQLEDLVEKLNPRRDPSRNPIYDIGMVVQNFDQPIDLNGMNLEGINITPRQFETGNSRFDITLSIYELIEGIQLVMEYCTSLFKRETIERLAGHFIHILGQVSRHPGVGITGIDLLTAKEKHLLLEVFNSTYGEFPGDKTIHELFEERVKKTPAHAAVVCGDQCLTYGQLQERSNQLGNYLHRQYHQIHIETGGSGFGVGLLLDRSPMLIIGLLGILKSGGFYVPMDPFLPGNRLRFILEDIGLPAVISQEKYIKRLSRLQCDCQYLQSFLCLDNMDIYNGEEKETNGLRQYPTGLLYKDINANEFMYAAYTSGTTGNPRGVLVRHRGVVNMVDFHWQLFGIDRTYRMSQLASIGFGAMAFEVWPGILRGATLYIVEDSIRTDPLSMKEWLIKHRITMSFQSPMMGEALLKEEWDEGVAALKILCTAGDRLSIYPAQVYPFRLYNLYGATEDSIWTTWKEVEIKSSGEKFPPIGKPVRNHQIYIIGANMNLRPPGVTGELCIGGEGVAAGYINNPELTSDKFNHKNQLPTQHLSKFNKKFLPGGPGGAVFTKKAPPGCQRQIIYKTGDQARWLPRGDIEFLGRIDHQVKIRGFRIEFAEIEIQSLTHDRIKKAVVTAREDDSGDKYLCLYYISEREIEINELKKHLAGELPAYMIPSYFVRLEEIPLTSSGKVKRSALPAPLRAGFGKGENKDLAPSNEVEEKLSIIWSDILKIKKGGIGMSDNFFEIGGHSMRAAVLKSKISKEFEVELPFGQIFKTPTIRGLAAGIQGLKKSIYSAVKPVEKMEYYPQSSSQKRLFFFHYFQDIGTSNNMPAAIKIKGKTDRQRFREVIRQLVTRHESLRTSFFIAANQPVQRVHDRVDFEVEEIRFHETNEKIKQAIRDFLRPFDLSKAPLLRVRLLSLQTDENLLLFDMHHIICDGASIGILVNEFLSLYNGEGLAPLQIQYKDISVWQVHLVQTGKLKDQLDYWLNLYKDWDEIPPLNLPLSCPRPEVFSFQGDTYQFALEREDAHHFRELVTTRGATIFMGLLAVLYVLLHKYTGQSDIVVGYGIDNRTHADFESIIGMFGSGLPIRNQVDRTMSFAAFLEVVKEKCINAFENQDIPLEDLIRQINPARDLSRNPLFDVLFVVPYQGESRKCSKGMDIELMPVENKTASFDFALMAYVEQGMIVFAIEYCTSLFNPGTIAGFSENFLTILRQINRNPETPISGIHILPETIKHFKFNTEDSAPAKEKNKEYVPPRNQVEKKLVEIWTEIVSRKNTGQYPIGIDDDFFLGGGDSIGVTIVMSKIDKLWNLQVPLSEAFKCKTIRELAKLIQALKTEKKKKKE